MDQLFFEIPEDQELMAKLIEAVPSTWSWIDGGLHAPTNLVASGAAVADTGFALGRFMNIHPCIVGRKQAKPDLFAIMVEQKLPDFVSFDEAGFDHGAGRTPTLDIAKCIAVGLLQKGYRGHLHFFKGWEHDDKYANDARCEIAFEPWEGAPVYGEEAGRQPARVKLEWSFNGKDDVEPIVAVCRSLNLREYKPTPGPRSFAHV